MEQTKKSYEQNDTLIIPLFHFHLFRQFFLGLQKFERKYHSKFKSPCRLGLEYADFISLQKVKTPPPRVVLFGESYPPAEMQSVHLMVMLQFGRSEECGVAIHFYFSPAHTEWLYMSGSKLRVKYISLKLFIYSRNT